MADGQVTQGSEIVKPNVRKVRRINDNVIGGFAGRSPARSVSPDLSSRPATHCSVDTATYICTFGILRKDTVSCAIASAGVDKVFVCKHLCRCHRRCVHIV